MNTFMSRKQTIVQQPPLRRMLSDEFIRIYHRYALKRWRSEPTERIVRSLESGRLCSPFPIASGGFHGDERQGDS